MYITFLVLCITRLPWLYRLYLHLLRVTWRVLKWWVKTTLSVTEEREKICTSKSLCSRIFHRKLAQHILCLLNSSLSSYTVWNFFISRMIFNQFTLDDLQPWLVKKSMIGCDQNGDLSARVERGFSLSPTVENMSRILGCNYRREVTTFLSRCHRQWPTMNRLDLAIVALRRTRRGTALLS